jgi:nitroreductase
MEHDTRVSNDTIIRQLKWRYATKKFDPARKISAHDWRTLEEALVLTPSSYGLQPWKFFVVETPELRQKLLPVSWGQTQVVDASHTLVLAIKKNLSAADVERYVQRMAEIREVPVDSLARFKDMLIGFISGPRKATLNDWASHQVYIALGNFMTTAALMGIDTCPMEGIDPAKYDEILGLDKIGYGTVVACPAGYRAAEDKYAASPKVRFKHEDVIAHL